MKITARERKGIWILLIAMVAFILAIPLMGLVQRRQVSRVERDCSEIMRSGMSAAEAGAHLAELGYEVIDDGDDSVIWGRQELSLSIMPGWVTCTVNYHEDGFPIQWNVDTFGVSL